MASRNKANQHAPRNFIPSKEFFFFGADAYEPKALAGYLKNEKAISTYHANVAWASETGKGLLFIGDKKAPTGIINLVSSHFAPSGQNMQSLTPPPSLMPASPRPMAPTSSP